jgi:hypothetical protein
MQQLKDYRFGLRRDAFEKFQNLGVIDYKIQILRGVKHVLDSMPKFTENFKYDFSNLIFYY